MWPKTDVKHSHCQPREGPFVDVGPCKHWGPPCAQGPASTSPSLLSVPLTFPPPLAFPAPLAFPPLAFPATLSCPCLFLGCHSAPHRSLSLCCRPPHRNPFVTLPSITVTQNRRIFYLVSLLNQVLCSLFFILKVDECHTLFFLTKKQKLNRVALMGPGWFCPLVSGS